MIEPFSELTHAQDALAVGDKRAARDILMNLVRRDPANIEAWLLLSQAMESIEHRRDCVRQALQLDPENQAAHAALAEIEHLAANPPPPRRSRRSADTQAVPAAAATTPSSAGKPSPGGSHPGGQSGSGAKPAAGSALTAIGYGLAGGLLLGLVIVAAVIWLKKPAPEALRRDEAAAATQTVPMSPSAPTTAAMKPASASPSAPITAVEPFAHGPTGVSGVRPGAWQLIQDDDNSFQYTTSTAAPDGFLVELIPIGPGGTPDSATRAWFQAIKGTPLPPRVRQETYNADGSGALLIEYDAEVANAAPLPLTVYARSMVSTRGLVRASITLPSELFAGQEETLAREIIDTLRIN